MTPASPREHGARANGASVAASRILSFFALSLFVFAALRDTSTSHRTAPVYLTSGGRKVRVFDAPWFCHGGPCAPFGPQKGGPGFEARAYEPATYVAVNVTAINAEVALAEGLLLIERYARGANAANATVPRGAPTLVILRPTSDEYAGLAPLFTVAAYLPPPGPAQAATRSAAAARRAAPPGPPAPGQQPSAAATAGAAAAAAHPTTTTLTPPPPLVHPAPTDDGVFLAARPAATTYVLPFGGFARGGVALANAARLALSLTRAGADFGAGGPFGLALYDPPTRWTGRHNEVWVWGGGAGWERGGGSGGAASARPVATHLLL